MKRSRPAVASFTLIEVVLALGLVSFCAVTLIALLPMGLKSANDARQWAGAASAIEKISVSIREAPSQSGQYAAIGSYSNLVWKLGTPGPVTETLTNISLSGDLVSDSSQHLVAHIELMPPANAVSTGTAFISVAWPSQAVWNAPTTNWIHAQGSLATALTFVPGL